MKQIDTQQQIWEEQQKVLAPRVDVPLEGGYQPHTGDVVIGLDIQYAGDQAHVAADVTRWNAEHIGTYAGTIHVDIPYISGFFCFREGPPLLSILHALTTVGVPKPDVLIVDGHGLAHPRRFGAACWVGLAADCPTLGCAKDTLVRFTGTLAEAKGSTLDVCVEHDIVGHVVRRVDGVRPVYVSVGHQITLQTATDMIVSLPSSFRIPDTIRRADRAARECAKGTQTSDWIALGTLTPVSAPWDARSS